MINDHKNLGKWKTHLTMKPKYISLTDEKRTINSKSDSSVIMTGTDTNKIIHKLFY